MKVKFAKIQRMVSCNSWCTANTEKPETVRNSEVTQCELCHVLLCLLDAL